MHAASQPHVRTEHIILFRMYRRSNFVVQFIFVKCMIIIIIIITLFAQDSKLQSILTNNKVLI